MTILLENDHDYACIYLIGSLNATGNSLLIDRHIRVRTNFICEICLRPEGACTQQLIIVVIALHNLRLAYGCIILPVEPSSQEINS